MRWTSRITLPLVIALGIAVTVPSILNVVSQASANLRLAPTLRAPGTIRVYLAGGSYALYENVEDASYPLNPTSVTVIGASGHLRTTSARSDLSGIGSPFATTVYSGVVGFTVRSSGNYVITASSGQSGVLLGKSFSSLVHELAGWVVSAMVGFLVVVVGFVLLLLRRSRAKRAASF
jgi:hypothetical protein